jgi:hypothetical protein
MVETEPTFYLDDEGAFWFRCPHGRFWDEEEKEPIIHRPPLGPEGWTVQQKDPLTITPSISKPDCGCHGFITDGKWVPA